MLPCTVAAVLILASLSGTAAAARAGAASGPDDVYPTYGVHNDSHADLCVHPRCVYTRAKERTH
jgi:hypothetical protein